MKLIKNILLIFCISFMFILGVNAETGYTTDKTGISLRNQPSTASDNYIITTIPYNEYFYISNMNAATGGNCRKGWYYVYYKGNYGYVCSSIVKILGEADTTYDRPWTSPKKAIVGGAKFISSGYISKGQNTSYLKKFNVNPNSFYSFYAHQYMANLRAPAGEANTTYKSLYNNNLLNNSFNFTIPVYTDMPSQSYSYNGLYQVDISTTDETDDSFENMIRDFPDSYKPALRYIHKLHNNWSFTPLKTNLSFDEVFNNEKWVSSIEINAGVCEGNPYTVTESGWCIGNDDVTRFFIDPRNFLTEKYVFMFENLGYSELYNEDVVNAVIKDTFMSGNSELDNQSYKSIFVEAGKTASISPLYLASLARQESGTSLSNTTNGQEFSYDGFTYKGLYNFFNIGASSGEANPALAGLVYANGGRGVNNVITPDNGDSNNNNNNTPSDNVNVSNNFIEMLKVGKTGEYLRGYDLGTTVENIKNKVGNSANVVIKDSNGYEKNGNDTIGTGYTIEISNGNGRMTYTYVMYGDLNGDGEINSADLLKMRQYLLGQVSLNGAFKISAYLNGDEEINSADLLRIRQHLLGTSPIGQ